MRVEVYSLSDKTRGGMICLAVFAESQQLLWLTLPVKILDVADGTRVSVRGSATKIRAGDALNGQMLQLIRKSGLSGPPKSVDLFAWTLPATVEPSPTDVFERLVRLSIIKFPLFAGERRLDSGELPYAPVAAVPPPDSNDEAQAEPQEEDDDATEDASPRNWIYFGPPGTGKTWMVRGLLKADYEDATDTAASRDWRQQFIAESNDMSWWQRIAAALYDLGGKAKVPELMQHAFIRGAAVDDKMLRPTLWSTMSSHAVTESATVKTTRRTDPAVFDKSEDSIWRFAGDWQEECAEVIALVDKLKLGGQSAQPIERHSFVTFHQSYGYEEFVEGLRPVLDGDNEEVRYEIRDGAFKLLCKRARLSPDQRFAMVIDEINRGNIAKIFGELITLIEADKREGARNAMAVELPYSRSRFSVPVNVDIIGTMNTADRSLALLDTALRRRFEFKEMMPDLTALAGLKVTSSSVVDVQRLLGAINDRIEALFDREHTVGHAYFTPLQDVADGDFRMKKLADIFEHRVLPLLQEYFFEDWQKVRLVLGDNRKRQPEQFVIEVGEHESDLGRLFGGDHGLSSFATKRRYRVQPAAFLNPASYVGVYEPPRP